MSPLFQQASACPPLLPCVSFARRIPGGLRYCWDAMAGPHCGKCKGWYDEEFDLFGCFDHGGWSMAIKYACACGRKFSADDKHAGRQTRCVHCGAEFEIPPLPSSNIASDRDGFPFHLTCACGKRFTVQEKYVGRKARCPDCGLEFDVRRPALQRANRAPAPAPPASPPINVALECEDLRLNRSVSTAPGHIKAPELTELPDLSGLSPLKKSHNLLRVWISTDCSRIVRCFWIRDLVGAIAAWDAGDCRADRSVRGTDHWPHRIRHRFHHWEEPPCYECARDQARVFKGFANSLPVCQRGG